MSNTRKTTQEEQDQLKEIINKQVDKFNHPASIVLELSRIGFYQAELTSKLWHLVEHQEQDAKPKKSKKSIKVKKPASTEQEAVSDSKN